MWKQTENKARKIWNHSLYLYNMVLTETPFDLASKWIWMSWWWSLRFVYIYSIYQLKKRVCQHRYENQKKENKIKTVKTLNETFIFQMNKKQVQIKWMKMLTIDASKWKRILFIIRKTHLQSIHSPTRTSSSSTSSKSSFISLERIFFVFIHFQK